MARRGLQVVLIAVAIVLAVVAALALWFSQSEPRPIETEPTATASGPPASPLASESESVVDPGVAARGWVPEPITTDPDAYARAAIEAAGTFDTAKSTRDEWVSWLKTWFTPSPLYADPSDAMTQMERYQRELEDVVLLPQEDWDDLASTDGSVSAKVSSPLDYLELPETSRAHMWTATADVELTYSRADDSSKDYNDTVRVSVQIVCEGLSLPVPGSNQQPTDCKVVRFFDQAVS